MKKYIGTKQIEAEPMTMGEAFEKNLLLTDGIEPTEAEKRKTGYHVKDEYGSENWSPAEPFEEAYHEGTIEDVSDGYHTFKELYQYRMLYNAAFFNELNKNGRGIPVCKSHRHSDGELCFGGGWFIVMAELPTGQVSNHYENKDWDLFNVPELETGWKWDGHTPNEAANRIEAYLKFNQVSTFLDRLQIEHDDLVEKYDKCEKFVDSDKFREIVQEDYPAFLLSLQRNVMNRYGSILEQRMSIAKGETSITTLPRMSFGDAIEALKFGLAIRRSGWNGKGLMVFKQIPAHIESDIIPKMQSLPQSAKDLILKGKGFIDYTSQCLIYNENTGRADSWVPSISDVFAEDWEIVQ